jgi:hypothetical protein
MGPPAPSVHSAGVAGTSVLVPSSSLALMFSRCACTVLALMRRRRAISATVRPAAEHLEDLELAVGEVSR